MTARLIRVLALAVLRGDLVAAHAIRCRLRRVEWDAYYTSERDWAPGELMEAYGK